MTSLPRNATDGNQAPPIPGFRLGYPQQAPGLAFGADEPTPVKLSEKHRPKTLCEVFGQGSAICQLQSFLESPYPVAFLFEGPTGVGKTSTALALASELGVDPDWSLIHIKSGEQDGEAVMTALKTLRFSAVNGGWKMIVVDEADYMSDKCRNLWLSALEDLPGRSIVVFTTNHPEKFQDRFLDRCERITFRADAQTLSLDAESLVKHVWRSETGRDDHPALESLPNVVDRHGNVSFRRILSALEPLLRAARSAPTIATPEPEPIADTPAPALPEPEPTPAPEFSEPKPVKARKSAKHDNIGAIESDRIIVKAIDQFRHSLPVGRVFAFEAAQMVFDCLAPSEVRRINSRLVALGCGTLRGSDFSARDRFCNFVDCCVTGLSVTFPTPEPSDPTTPPEVAPGATPETSVAVPKGWDAIEADDVRLDPAPALPDAELADDDDEPTGPTILARDVEPGMVLVVGPYPLTGAEVMRIERGDGMVEVHFPGCYHSVSPDHAFRIAPDPDPAPTLPEGPDDKPSDPAPGLPEFTADEVIGRIDDPTDSALEGRARLARVEPSPYPDGEWDSTGRIRRSWMRAIESGIRLAVESVLSIIGYKASLAWLLMEPLEQRDFAEWLAFLDYKPGEYLYGRLAPDEAWESFIEECISGTPVFFPITTRPLPPQGDDDAGHLPALDDDQRRAGVQDVSQAVDKSRESIDIRAGQIIHDRDYHGTSGPALAGTEGLRGDRPGPGPFAALVILIHGLDQPVITHATWETHDAPTEEAGPPGSALREADRRDGGRDDQAGVDPLQRLREVQGRHDEEFAGPALDEPIHLRQVRPQGEPLTPPRSFLTLTIGGREYGLTIDGDTFTLEHPGGRTYEVTRGDDSTCTCPDAVYRRNGLDAAGCRHQKALRDVGLLPPAPDFPEALPLPAWADELIAERFFGMS